MARQSGVNSDSCRNDSSADFRHDAVCSKNSDNPGMLSADELGIILLSLKVAGASVLFSLPLALGCALLLARGSFTGKTLFDAVVHLPLVLPPVVIGYALLVLFGRQGVIGALLHDWLGITLAFRWTGAALAAAVMGFPLMVRAIRLSLSAIDPKLESAARTLGASGWQVFFTITLPLDAQDHQPSIKGEQA
mgnify:CR=1 FL=1